MFVRRIKFSAVISFVPANRIKQKLTVGSSTVFQRLAADDVVRYQSGKVNKCRLRRACNKVLRATVHLWVNSSRLTCEWAQAYYQTKRDEGQSHASALRCLGKRWLKILWRFWQNHEACNEAKYLAQLQKRGALTWTKLQTPQTV